VLLPRRRYIRDESLCQSVDSNAKYFRWLPTKVSPSEKLRGNRRHVAVKQPSAGRQTDRCVGHTLQLGDRQKIVNSVYVPVIIAADDLIMLSMSIRTVRPAGVDSKTKTDKDDGSHTKDLQKVKRFVARAKSRQ
jgi:hypothetical protein